LIRCSLGSGTDSFDESSWTAVSRDEVLKMVGVTGFEPATSSSRKSEDFQSQVIDSKGVGPRDEARARLEFILELIRNFRMILQTAESPCSAPAPRATPEQQEELPNDSSPKTGTKTKGEDP
jgi:hypothetical protein